MLITDLFGDAAVVSVTAGALGGVVRWLTLKESPRDGSISVIVGGLSAVYLTPAIFQVVSPALSIIVEDLSARLRLAGFLCGLLGVGIIGFIIDVVKALRFNGGKKK